MSEVELRRKLEELYACGRNTGTGQSDAVHDGYVATLLNDIVSVAAKRSTAVACAIVFKGEPGEPAQILLQRQNAPGRYKHDQWFLPGGKLEYGESFFDAALRELREETDIEVTDARLLTATSYVSPEGEHYVEGVLVAGRWHTRTNRGVRNMITAKASELRFFPLADLPDELGAVEDNLFRGPLAQEGVTQFTLAEICNSRR